MARQRDYKAEYARRLERAAAAGKSKQEARGHGKPPSQGGKSEYRRRRENRLRRKFGHYPSPDPQFTLAGLIDDLGYAGAERFLDHRNAAHDAYTAQETVIAQYEWGEMYDVVDDYMETDDVPEYYYYYH